MDNENKTVQLTATHDKKQCLSWDENKKVEPSENPNKKLHVTRDARTNAPVRENQSDRLQQNQDRNSALSPNENSRFVQNQFPSLRPGGARPGPAAGRNQNGKQRVRLDRTEPRYLMPHKKRNWLS
jgi:hypothetical protein